jgi:hypothetical protein
MKRMKKRTIINHVKTNIKLIPSIVHEQKVYRNNKTQHLHLPNHISKPQSRPTQHKNLESFRLIFKKRG